MSTTIRTDTAAHCLVDLAASFAATGTGPVHHSANLGFPGEIRCRDGRDIIVSGARGEGGALLPDCYTLDVCAEIGGRIATHESYDLDARGLVRVAARGV